MDKQAIEQIQNSASIPELIKQARNIAEKPCVTLPEGYTVQSLEKYMEHAYRYDAAYSTTSIEDFTRYNENHQQDNAVCFANPETMTAKTIFDIGSRDEPGHKLHTANLKLKSTAAHTALRRVAENGPALDQKQASDFIEDWSECMSIDSADEKMTPPQAAAALRNLTIEAAKEINSKTDDFGESMSAMEKIEAKNQDKLPHRIRFTCQPFNGLSHREFVVRVGILTGHDKPKISLRIIQIEKHEEDMADEFRDLLNKQFKKINVETYIGTGS